VSGPLRIGLIGCGRLAEVGYAPALALTPGVRAVAVADPDPTASATVAAALGNGSPVAEHADADALVAGAGVDAVVIASPPAEHLASARAASAAGLPALVEKPPAPDLEGAIELAALAPAPWIGFNRRFAQGRLRDALPRGGRIELELELRYRRAGWGARTVADDALLDLAPHLVDLALMLGGGPGEVRGARIGPERAELELETGRGPARIRCATDRSYRERVAVRTRGRDPVVWSRGGLRDNLAARLRRDRHPLVGSLARQLAAFASAVRGADPGPLASAEDGVRTMAVIEAARASA